ncbi:MAG: hypothetical protein NTY68_04380 [Candidatus Micrarchaeota archaeon]|nr:hypothetical protein [Candidatus Micrarchaeota archaeon]
MKKGFFFSLSAIMLLIFAVVSITQHLSVVRENEMFYSDLISLTSYQTVFSNFNTNSLSTMVGSVGKFAMFKMANYTAYNQITVPSGRDNYTNIRLVFQDLINKGNTSISYFENQSYKPLNYSSAEMNNTLAGVASDLNMNFNSIGYVVNEISFNITNISMASPSLVNITADITINVSDSLGRSSYFVSYRNFSSNISIEGLPDPLANNYVQREGFNKGGNSNLSRWFLFRHDGDDIEYEFDSSVSTYATTAEAGQGWFYGPIISVGEVARSGDPQDPGLYILYGNFTNMTDGTSVENWSHYGAYIITSNILYDEFDCCEDNCSESVDSVFNPTKWDTLNSGACKPRPSDEGINTTKPFVVAPDFDLSDIPDSTDFRNENNNITLFFATGNYPDDVSIDPKDKTITTVKFLGIETLRDQFICDYYYQTELGPNFLQRMLVNGYSYSDEDNGLTSMYVENEFLGKSSEQYPFRDYSSADFEFMDQYSNSGRSPGDLVVVRGMPGCKSRDMCMLTNSLRSIIMTDDLSSNLRIPSSLTCLISDRKCWGAQ